MLPSDMNLKIKTSTVRYNNKILISDGNFSLRKNDEVNLMVPAIKSHKTNLGSQNLMRLSMFDKLVITFSYELKSGFQFNHVINNK